MTGALFFCALAADENFHPADSAEHVDFRAIHRAERPDFYARDIRRDAGRYEIRPERRGNVCEFVRPTLWEAVRHAARICGDTRAISSIRVILLNRGDGFRDVLAAGSISLRTLQRRQREENDEENQPRDRENEGDFDDREASGRESFVVLFRVFEISAGDSVAIPRKIRSVISFAG